MPVRHADGLDAGQIQMMRLVEAPGGGVELAKIDELGRSRAGLFQQFALGIVAHRSGPRDPAARRLEVPTARPVPEAVEQRDRAAEQGHDGRARRHDQPVVQPVGAIGEADGVAHHDQVRIDREHADPGVVGGEPLRAAMIARVAPRALDR